MTNGGTLTWSGGPVYDATAAAADTLANLAGGTIDLQDDGTAFAHLYSLDNVLANAGTLRKSAGSGTTTVGWAVNNSGTVNGQVGTLAFTDSVTNTGTITMANGAAINGVITSNSGGVVRGPVGGTGTYTGNQTFNSGSTLAAGGTTAAGRLVLNGNLAMTAGSTFHQSLNGSTVTTGFDRVEVFGTIDLGGATLAGDVTGFNPSSTDLYFILLNDGDDSVTGTFAGLDQGGAGRFGIWDFQISYTGDSLSNSITGGNDVVLYNFSPVPEPGSMLAVTAAGVGLAVLVRRRKRLTTA